MKRFPLLLITVLIPLPGAAQTEPNHLQTSPNVAKSSKPTPGLVGVGSSRAAEMSDDDRIKARMTFNERATARRPLGRGYSEAIDGVSSPELFMPYELFDYLLTAIGDNDRQRQATHAALDQRLPAFGYDASKFWAALAVAAKPYLVVRAEKQRRKEMSTVFTTATGEKIFVPVNREVCAARILALQDARQHLGGKEFDRFLYGAVAPISRHRESGSGEDRATQLKYMAGGCR